MAVSQKRVFEWLLLGAVIGVILTLAANFYARMAGDVQRLSFELAAEHFKTAVSGVRAHYYVYRGKPELEEGVVLHSALPGFEQSPGRQEADSVRVFLNARGWPASTQSRAAAEDGVQTAEECRQLWNAFLVRPPKAAIGAEEADYRVLVPRADTCRYQRLRPPLEGSYFDYSLLNGQVSLYLSAE